MSRNIVLALIAAALVSTNPAHAGEWKRQTDEETKIGLRIDAPWAKPGMGHYWERWNDRQTIHSYSATWYARSQNGPRVEIALYRLAPGRVWRRVSKLDEDTLTSWNYLEKKGVSETRKIPCRARECVAFKAGDIYHCAAFVSVRGVLGTSDASDRSDLVKGYYCHDTTAEISTEKLDEIINSVAIKK